MTCGQFCLSLTSLLPESYCPEVIFVLFVSELLAGGGQAPVNSAIAGFNTVPEDIPDKEVAAAVVTGVVVAASG